MAELKRPIEPFRIKSVEPIRQISRKERDAALRQAGFNVFNIPAEKVFLDLLTDSGLSAMSSGQWAGMMNSDESCAGSRNFFNLEEAVRNVFGFNHVIPAHQGRAAERLLFGSMLKKGDHVPANIHFNTSRAGLESMGATPVDLAVDECRDPDSGLPFKGNLDPKKLKKFIGAGKAARVPLVIMTVTNASGCGQPVSLENIREVSGICGRAGIPFFLDACRFAENAWFIKKREKGYGGKSVLEIAQEMFSYADGATMSAMKDALVNTGGFVTLDDDGQAERIRNLLVLGEGFPPGGGLAGRDLEAMARGLGEALDEEFLEYRTGQVAYLGGLLDAAGVPVFKPFGGHAIYLLADRFLPRIPRANYPGWALTAALYREYGIRAAEIGGVMFGKRNGAGRKEVFPELELVRLAIPRRVYTASHLDFMAESIIELYRDPEKIKGMRIVHETPLLRHFTARLEEI